VATFQPGEVVADVMAGIGPFAIPAALQGCKVSQALEAAMRIATAVESAAMLHDRTGACMMDCCVCDGLQLCDGLNPAPAAVGEPLHS